MINIHLNAEKLPPLLLVRVFVPLKKAKMSLILGFMLKHNVVSETLNK